LHAGKDAEDNRLYSPSATHGISATLPSLDEVPIQTISGLETCPRAKQMVALDKAEREQQDRPLVQAAVAAQRQEVLEPPLELPPWVYHLLV